MHLCGWFRGVFLGELFLLGDAAGDGLRATYVVCRRKGAFARSRKIFSAAEEVGQLADGAGFEILRLVLRDQVEALLQ